MLMGYFEHGDIANITSLSIPIKKSRNMIYREMAVASLLVASSTSSVRSGYTEPVGAARDSTAASCAAQLCRVAMKTRTRRGTKTS